MIEIVRNYNPVRDYFNNEFWNPDHDLNVDSTTVDREHKRLKNQGLELLCNAFRNNPSETIRQLNSDGYRVVVVCNTAYNVAGEQVYSLVSLWGKEKLTKKLNRFVRSIGLLR